MAFHDLQSYLQYLEKHNMLKRVSMEVDPEYEITEIVTRVVKEEGPAIIFDRVKGSKYPLAINFFGSHQLIEAALGMHPEELGEKLAKLIDIINPPSPSAIWKSRPYWSMMLASRPKSVGGAGCQQVVEEPDLDALPILKTWPGDGGRFVTFPLVMTREPTERTSNLGIYRMHVYSKNETGMHMQLGKGGGYHYHEAEKMNQPLELACVLGADPALMLTAIFPLPEGMEELAFSGVLRGERLKTTRAKTIDINVPANAEFILEGVVPPHERRREGPFGDHYGHYSEAADFPVFRINKVTRKKNPIFPAAVVGKPPQEDRYMGEASQMILKPFIKMIRPEVRDLWAFYEAGFHNLLVAAVETRHVREPIKTALGLLGEGQLSLSKCVVLVDPSVNVRSFPEVLGAIRRNYVAKEDFHLISRAALDTLDFTSFKMHLGSKMIIDATAGQAQPNPHRTFNVDPSDIAPGIRRWRILEDTLLAVEVEGNAPEILDRLVASPDLEGLSMVAAVSPDVDIEDNVSLMWGLFTRFDPARDIRFTNSALHGIKPIYEGLMGIDATWKTGYPEGLEMDERIIKRVDERWDRYWLPAG